ncbi:MAG: AzlC family ABC transporter permease [Clostridia bacterium]|nr:AzlC family ABC transporter permease [Clostridia bacterium]
MKSPFFRGVTHGIPIALGYLSVSFGFGILAVRLGLPVWAAVGISLTNLTSAGQAAGVEIIAAAGTLLEMVLTQLVINLRYALMGFSLSQKLDDTFTTSRRLVVSFGITDEVYAVAVSQPGQLTASYMLGLISTPIVGWSVGTLLGAVAGQLLPSAVSDAMGLVLYGMFLAIILPPARKDRRVLLVVVLAAVFSSVFRYVLPMVSGGFAVIISAVAASLAGALLFPVEEEETA